VAQVAFSNSLLMEAIEGATIVHGDINEDEGVTLHLGDGRVLVFVSDSFALMLKRISVRGLH
jgi:hypothetical protein